MCTKTLSLSLRYRLISLSNLFLDLFLKMFKNNFTAIAVGQSPMYIPDESLKCKWFIIHIILTFCEWRKFTGTFILEIRFVAVRIKVTKIPHNQVLLSLILLIASYLPDTDGDHFPFQISSKTFNMLSLYFGWKNN